MSMPPDMVGGPPPGLTGPPAGMAGPPPAPLGGGSPVQALGAAVAQLDSQQQMQDAAATNALMALAQALDGQASPQAVAAQSSPGPGLPPPPPGVTP
jgi:hypothetical protein